MELRPRALRKRLKKGTVLIEMREPEELWAGPSANAIPMDRAELALVIDKLLPDLAIPIACCCARGIRSALAAYQLQELGYAKVASRLDRLDHGDQRLSLQSAKELLD